MKRQKIEDQNKVNKDESVGGHNPQLLIREVLFFKYYQGLHRVLGIYEGSNYARHQFPCRKYGRH